MKIGYIGLGALGAALARRFLPAHALTVWDRNPAAVSELVAAGAEAATSAAEVARKCDVVLLCLPRSSDVRQVLFGPDGLLEGLTPGKLVIDQTSGVASETRAFALRLAERGVALMDAAVSGNSGIVAAGGATIMAAAPDETWERGLPILRAITETVYRCGSRVGDGQAMKTVNNAMNGACRLGTLEIVAMGRKMGLSLDAMIDVLNKGAGRNQTTDRMLPALAQGKPSTNFAMALMLKDLNQAIAMGMDCGVPMPISAVTRGLLQIGVNLLGENASLEQIVGLIESMAGTKIAGPAEEANPQPVPVQAADGQDLKIGYVGLGAMGSALARRLMVSRQMHVFDVRPDTVSAFAAEGAIAALDLPSLARACDVIMVCLPTSAVVREAIFGKGGLAEGLSAGKIIVDQTSGDPNETRAIAAELQQRGVALVDAPVSGGPRGAVAGTIAIMCGGEHYAYARVQPILASISPNIVYCGRIGNGHVAKIVNNAASSLGRLVTYEGASLGLKVGLKLEDMDRIINRSSGWSLASQRILPVLASGKQAANFQVGLMTKDLRLAASLAISCGAPMMISSAVRGVFEEGTNRLGGNSNIDEMARLYEDTGAVRFTAT